MKSVFIYFFSLIIVIISCRRGDFGEVRPNHPLPQFSSDGVWIANEGLFGFGNGEISFIDMTKKQIFNGMFSAANGITPGDIPFHLLVDDELILLSVNNSERVWIVSYYDFSVQHNIPQIISPRYIEKVAHKKYAVSSFANDSLYFIDMTSGLPVVSPMYTGKSTESLIMHGNFLYAANWSAYGGDFDNTTVQLINPFTQTIEKQIQVGKEPNSMAIDKDGNLWVLCSGGYMNEEKPRLCVVSTLSNSVIREYEFSDISQSPFSLSISADGDIVYFINEHIYRMYIYDLALPGTEFIRADGGNLYSLNASMYSNMLFVSDAGNYQLPGSVFIYDAWGNLLQQYTAGIIPGAMIVNQ